MPTLGSKAQNMAIRCLSGAISAEWQAVRHQKSSLLYRAFKICFLLHRQSLNIAKLQLPAFLKVLWQCFASPTQRFCYESSSGRSFNYLLVVKQHLSLPTCIPFKMRPNVFDIAVVCKGLQELSAVILDRSGKSSTWEHNKCLTGSDHLPFISFFSSFTTNEMKILWGWQTGKLVNRWNIWCIFFSGYQALNSREISTVISNNCSLKPQGIRVSQKILHMKVFISKAYMN